MDEDGWKSVEPLPKVNYPVVIGDWDFRKLVGVAALPVTLLIDHDGELADLDVVVSAEVRTPLPGTPWPERWFHSADFGGRWLTTRCVLFRPNQAGMLGNQRLRREER